MTRRLQPVPWLLLAPFLLALAAFWVMPLAQGFWLSLHSDALFDEPVWVGWSHYRTLLDDARFWHALRNTAYYAACSIPLVILFSLAVALLLRKAPRRFQGPLLLTLMLPGLTPPAVLAMLYVLVFNGPHGLLNALFVTPFGFSPIDWLRDPAFIKPALVLQTLWRWCGFVTLILYSGLAGIPREYQYLAKTEGAGGWHILLRITLPLLKHQLWFIAAFLLLDAFVLFEGSYVLLGGSGGTLDAGLLVIAYTYYTAFTLGHFGTAAAMGFALVPPLLSAVFLFTFPQWKRRQRRKMPAQA